MNALSKIILIFIFIGFNQSSLQAQFRIETGPTIMVPIGSLGPGDQNGYGGYLSGKYQLSDRFALTSSFSFYLFGRLGNDLNSLAQGLGLSESTLNLINALGGDSLLEVPKTHFFPITVGFEYYILKKKVRPYIGLDVGLYSSHSEALEVNLSELVIAFFEGLGQAVPPVSLGSIDLTNSDTNFGMAAVYGLQYQIDNRWRLDFTGKVQGVFFPDRDSVASLLTFQVGASYQFKR